MVKSLYQDSKKHGLPAMSRLPRLNLFGVPQHIIHRGNNRQICFSAEGDYWAYGGWLAE